MAFNGSGVYTLPGPQLASGDTVSATENNQCRNDMAVAFNDVLCRDGQSVPTADLPMGGFKLTGLAAGSANGDSVRYEQVTSAVAITGGTIDGAAITGSSISTSSINSTSIGIATPNTGAFTTLTAETVSGVGFDDYLAAPPFIGFTTPNNAAFDELFATSYKETKESIAASNIDLSIANYFSKTATGNITFTVSNVPTTGTVASFILDLIDGGLYTMTWWSGMQWAASTPPILSEGRDVLGFYTYDGGTTWTGLVLAKGVA